MARLAERLKAPGSHAEYQRIQCVLIRATLGSSASQIAQLLGWSTATVHVLHSRWAKEGDAVFDLRGRGGRRRQHLSLEQEQEQEQEHAAQHAAQSYGRPPSKRQSHACTYAPPR